jgi:hypothetical protein
VRHHLWNVDPRRTRCSNRRAAGTPALLAGLSSRFIRGTSCASLIFGRNYSSPASSRSAAALPARRRRGALAPGQVVLLVVLLLCSVFSKQTLVFFPLVLAWYEIGREAGALGDRIPSWLRSTPLLLLCAGAAIAGAVLLFGYALPLSRTAAIPPMTYFWSQLGNALTTSFFLPIGRPCFTTFRSMRAPGTSRSSWAPRS